MCEEHSVGSDLRLTHTLISICFCSTLALTPTRNSTFEFRSDLHSMNTHQ